MAKDNIFTTDVYWVNRYNQPPYSLQAIRIEENVLVGRILHREYRVNLADYQPKARTGHA